MSQQMHYDGPGSEQQIPPYQSYEGGYRDPLMGSPGQKLSVQDLGIGKGASAGQRLALAIVSLCLLVPLTAILLGTTYSNPITLVGGLIALGLVCLTIMVVNFVFNRSH